MTKKVDWVGENMIIPEADSGLIGRLSIAFGPTDVLTTEKLSSALSLLNKNLNKDNEIRLCIDKAEEDTAGDLTIKIYEEIKVDATNARYCEVASLVVDAITDAGSFRSFNLSGIGYGEGNIKLSADFAATAGAWADVTGYLLKDIVVHGGSRYRCISAHTSEEANDAPGAGTNWTDKWELDTFTVYAALYRK